MRKKHKIFTLIIFSFLLTGCPPTEKTITYNTIKSVRPLLFSFDKNGVYPHLDEFYPEQIGIGVYPDSISSRTEIASSFSFGNYAYAKSNPNRTIYLNSIDSLNVYTIYDFDENHPAGSNINDILLHLDGMGETLKLNIFDLSSTSHSFKFSTIPKNDSLQFKVTGRITKERAFSNETKLVILE